MSKSIKPLPKTHTDVLPTMLSDYIVPLATDDQVISQSTYLDVDEMEKFWLQHVVAVCCGETQDDQTSINISWSAYFAGLQAQASCNCYTTSHSPAMVRHGMDIIAQITAHVNPGQIPVFTVDQPLYVIAKTYSGHMDGHMDSMLL